MTSPAMAESSMPPDTRAEALAWLAAAREHLDSARLEQNAARVRCFHGQRAVEFSLKAVLIDHGVAYPKTHALYRLIERIPIDMPPQIDLSAKLTAYAVQEMYPDTFTSLDEGDAKQAAKLAGVIVDWATSLLN